MLDNHQKVGNPFVSALVTIALALLALPIVVGLIGLAFRFCRWGLGYGWW